MNDLKINILLSIILILIINLIIINSNYVKYENRNNNLKFKIEKINNNSDSLKYVNDSLEYVNDSLKYEIKKIRKFQDFLKDIAIRESSGNSKSINQFGMIGLYQFNPKTLDFLGYCKNDYFNSIETQNKAMISYLKFNKSILYKYIEKYDGKYHKGIYITASGILAGAHLTGAGGVIEFFEDIGKYKQYDGNNIHVSEYIKDFSGYDILALLN